MSFLALLLLIKIVVTLLFAAGPLMLLSKDRLDRLGGFGENSLTVYRLYGIGILSLLVVYSFGVDVAMSGAFPLYAVAMGVVSNGGAALVLMGSGELNKRPWIVGFFAAIAAGLVLAFFAPELALRPLW